MKQTNFHIRGCVLIAMSHLPYTVFLLHQHLFSEGLKKKNQHLWFAENAWDISANMPNFIVYCFSVVRDHESIEINLCKYHIGIIKWISWKHSLQSHILQEQSFIRSGCVIKNACFFFFFFFPGTKQHLKC